jgi:pimeloyl-ACP methyl ester carboxylesterase
METISIDVSPALPFDPEPAALAATVWQAPVGRPKAVLVCWPGGSYSRTYWDMQLDGFEGYSFAEHLAAKGFTVVAIDPLGVGESSRPKEVDAVTLEAMAAAAAEAVRVVHTEIAGGGVPVIGVGHSLGACLTIVEQALFSSYDAVVDLGFTHGAKITHTPVSADAAGREALDVAVEQAKGFFPDTWDDGYALAPREPNHAWLHDPDVPSEIIAEDDRRASAWPRQSYVGALMAGHSASYAARVTVPVLIGFGEHDVPEHPHDDVAFYGASRDVTLMVLPGSAHCHNFAGTRAVLWDRLADWADSFARGVWSAR